MIPLTLKMESNIHAYLPKYSSTKERKSGATKHSIQNSKWSFSLDFLFELNILRFYAHAEILF